MSNATKFRCHFCHKIVDARKDDWTEMKSPIDVKLCGSCGKEFEKLARKYHEEDGGPQVFTDTVLDVG